MCNAEQALAHLFSESAVDSRLQCLNLEAHHVQIFDCVSNRMMIFCEFLQIMDFKCALLRFGFEFRDRLVGVFLQRRNV